MDYNNVLFFALSLVIYVTYIPKDRGNSTLLLFSLILIISGFYLITRIAFHGIRRKLERRAFPEMRATHVLGVLEKRFVTLALALYLGLVYGCDLKEVMWRLPIFEKSSFLDLVAGFFPFYLLLTITWSNSFELFQAGTGSNAGRGRYVLLQSKINAPIFVPVFFFALIRDVIAYLFGKSASSAELISYGEGLWFLPLLVLMIVFYPAVMRFLWGCYPLPDGARRKKFEEYCEKAGLKVSGIFIWPGVHERFLTAGVTGIFGKLRYLFVTPALLDLLTDDEMESVIAHEAGHIKKRHMYYYVLLFLGFPLLVELLFDLTSLAYYGVSDVLPAQLVTRVSDPSIISLASLFALTIFILAYMRMFFGMLSRNFERQADLHVFEVVGHPLHLISSLEKIADSAGRIRNIPNWHHFSVGERVAFLMDALRDRHTGALHEAKVRRMKMVFVATFVGVLFLVGALNYPQFRMGIELNLAERQVQRLIAARPEDAGLQLYLADIYFERKRYDQAESVYLALLRSDPTNVNALNNLAWLYATARDVRFRNSAKALTLSLKAAELKREAYILDTLAEAYFVNGRNEEALQTIEAAIALKPENLEYYVAQKQKFLAGKGSYS